MESKYPVKSLRMRGMNLNRCILRMFEDTFLLGATQMIITGSLYVFRRQFLTKHCVTKQCLGKSDFGLMHIAHAHTRMRMYAYQTEDVIFELPEVRTCSVNQELVDVVFYGGGLIGMVKF